MAMMTTPAISIQIARPVGHDVKTCDQVEVSEATASIPAIVTMAPMATHTTEVALLMPGLGE